VLDRHFSPPLPVSLIVAALGLIAWMCARGSPNVGLPLVYLALTAAALGAAYHHYRRDVYAADDIAHFAKDEPAPVQLRGFLDDEPLHNRAPADDPLRSLSRNGNTTTVLRVSAMRRGDNWMSASGRLRVIGVEGWPELHVGDAVELVGQLARVPPPGNPGEFDYAGQLRDQGIRTVLTAETAQQHSISIYIQLIIRKGSWVIHPAALIAACLDAAAPKARSSARSVSACSWGWTRQTPG
jgi:hypothetical protein